jgi:deoxyadenosine/deoxycytidine kinase
MHIAVAGNIGAGKTTLAHRLATHFDWTPYFESVDDNPYLADFYEDMERWSFHLQIYFLNSRFNQVQRVRQNPKPTIQDRTIYEDAHVFALNLVDSGLMDKRDYENYLQVYQNMLKFITPPDLLIYLKADLPKLKHHIQKRGRGYESHIPDEYLLNLNQHYENWIDQYCEGELMVIDMNERDFVNNQGDWDSLLNGIASRLSAKTLS